MTKRTAQVELDIPEPWLAIIDELADAMSDGGKATSRDDVLRTALLQGLNDLRSRLLRGSREAITKPTLPAAPFAKGKPRS